MSYTIPAGEIRTTSAAEKQLQTIPAAVKMYYFGEMCTTSGAVEMCTTSGVQMRTTSGVEMHHSGAGWWLAAADLVRAEESPGSAPTPSEINYSLPAPAPHHPSPLFQPLTILALFHIALYSIHF